MDQRLWSRGDKQSTNRSKTQYTSKCCSTTTRSTERLTKLKRQIASRNRTRISMPILPYVDLPQHGPAVKKRQAVDSDLNSTAIDSALGASVSAVATGVPVVDFPVSISVIASVSLPVVPSVPPFPTTLVVPSVPAVPPFPFPASTITSTAIVPSTTSTSLAISTTTSSHISSSSSSSKTSSPSSSTKTSSPPSSRTSTTTTSSSSSSSSSTTSSLSRSSPLTLSSTNGSITSTQTFPSTAATQSPIAQTTSTGGTFGVASIAAGDSTSSSSIDTISSTFAVPFGTISSSSPLTRSASGSVTHATGVPVPGSPQTPNNNDNSNNVNTTGPTTPQIVGGVVGGIAGLAVLLILALFFIRLIKRKQSNSDRMLQGERDINPFPASRPQMSYANNPLAPIAASVMRRFSSVPRETPDPVPATQERSFQRISGRKLPSAFSAGITSDEVANAAKSPFADPDTKVVNADTLPSSRDNDQFLKETLMPSPARTPVIHSGGPYSGVLPGSNPFGDYSPRLGPPGGVIPRASLGSLARSNPSFDGSRGSRFTEDV